MQSTLLSGLLEDLFTASFQLLRQAGADAIIDQIKRDLRHLHRSLRCARVVFPSLEPKHLLVKRLLESFCPRGKFLADVAIQDLLECIYIPALLIASRFVN